MGLLDGEKSASDVAKPRQHESSETAQTIGSDLGLNNSDSSTSRSEKTIDEFNTSEQSSLRKAGSITQEGREVQGLDSKLRDRLDPVMTPGDGFSAVTEAASSETHREDSDRLEDEGSDWAVVNRDDRAVRPIPVDIEPASAASTNKGTIKSRSMWEGLGETDGSDVIVS